MKQKQINASINKPLEAGQSQTPPVPPNKRKIEENSANFKKKDSTS